MTIIATNATATLFETDKGYILTAVYGDDIVTFDFRDYDDAVDAFNDC